MEKSGLIGDDCLFFSPAVENHSAEILNIEVITFLYCSDKMHNTRLVRLLSTLNSKERKRFSDFLESPYFSSQRMHRILYRHLEKYFSKRDKILSSFKDSPTLDTKLERTGRVLERNNVLRAVYPGVDEEAAYKNLRRLSSELLDHWENFLLIEDAKTRHFDLHKKWVALLKMRDNQPELFEREREKLIQKMDKVGERDASWQLLRFRIEEIAKPAAKNAKSETEAFKKWLQS